MKSIFQKNKKWILDGGLGFELARRGFDLDHPLWTAKALVDDPKAIYQVHKDYLTAGANIILTASYQASIEGFVSHMNMYEREAQEVIFFTVELACRARADYLKESGEQRDIFIGASIGPYGAIIADKSEYSGGYDVSQSVVGDYYAKKIENLILPRGRGERKLAADFIAFETIPTKKEADLIMMILKTIPWAKAWLSFSRLDALVAALPMINNNSQIFGVGLNCVSSKIMSDALPTIKNLTDKSIVLYPNEKPDSRWFEAGADIVGGCCGVGVAEIQNFSQQCDAIKTHCP